MSLVCLSQKRFPNCNTKVTLAEGPGLWYHLVPDLCSDTPGGLQNVCLNEDPNLAYMGRLASFLQPLSIPSRPTLPPSAPPCQRDSSTQSDCFPGISFSLFLDPLLHMFREVQVRAKGWIVFCLVLPRTLEHTSCACSPPGRLGDPLESLSCGIT